MATLTEAEVRRLAEQAGFRGESVDIAQAVARAESGWRTDALGDTTLTNATWGPSVGLFQIRCLWADRGTGRPRDCDALRDPAFNARAAYAISSQGTNWNPWTVFKTGTYRQFLSNVGGTVSGLLSPLLGDHPITTQYGARNAYDGRAHYAIDWSAPAGTLIYAVADGEITRSDNNDPLGGNIIELTTADGLIAGYAHLEQRFAQIGQRVVAGQVIGTVGSTGEATTGAHLHFSVKDSGRYVNPLDRLDALTDSAAYQDFALWFKPGTRLAEFLVIPSAEDCPPGTSATIPGTGYAVRDMDICRIDVTSFEYKGIKIDATGAFGGLIGSPLEPVAMVGNFLVTLGGFLFNPENWLRLGALLLGLIMTGIGGMMVYRAT